MDINDALLYVSLVMGIVFVVGGFLLIFFLGPYFPAKERLGFGIILILYGIYRITSVILRLRKVESE